MQTTRTKCFILKAETLKNFLINQHFRIGGLNCGLAALNTLALALIMFLQFLGPHKLLNSRLEFIIRNQHIGGEMRTIERVGLHKQPYWHRLEKINRLTE